MAPSIAGKRLSSGQTIEESFENVEELPEYLKRLPKIAMRPVLEALHQGYVVLAPDVKDTYYHKLWVTMPW